MIDTAQDAQEYANSHFCSECCSWLRTPFKDGGYDILCGRDKTHVGQVPKRTGTTFLLDPVRGRVEYDIMTQEETGNGASLTTIPQDQEGMERRIKRAVGTGLFPHDLTPDQQAVIANLAIAYGLDPLRGELIIYHGKPFMGIDARRRKDADNGHHPDIKFRFLTGDEKENYKEVGAMADGDLVRVCILTTEWGNTVEATGTSYGRDAKQNNPSGTHRIEMADKRCEMRARYMAYGAIAPLPRFVATDLPLLDAVDDPMTVVSTARDITDEPPEASEGDYVPASAEDVEGLQTEMDNL